ncbi:hypothetical protein CHS0354_037929 [Potamilus streckersoni]|uniref:MAM domain-containing protein n=1 Tax=Potamilus streckersoni TaxID=2493646 RepID=A0AAE0T9B2_9BIVA|nr:hypothetical protein CHS0354_037929 [Potamilus streckersoni]
MNYTKTATPTTTTSSSATSSTVSVTTTATTISRIGAAAFTPGTTQNDHHNFQYNVHYDVYSDRKVSVATTNVCDLPRDGRQQLNVSCNFNTKDGCTALYNFTHNSYWRYQTKPFGTQWEGQIAGDHSTGGPGGYFLFTSNIFFARGNSDQLLTPFMPYHNICLRFWYNMPNVDSNIKVLANGHEIFRREYSRTQGWENKSIPLFLQTSVPLQIAFVSQKQRHGLLGIDDVVIEIERSASTFTLSTATIPTTLTTSRRTAPSVTNSTKATSPTTRTSLTTTTSTLSETTNSTTARISTSATTLVTTQTDKATNIAAPVNVCDLPRDGLQRLNISCDFNTEYGCTALYTAPLDNYWKYQTKSVGTQLDGTIAGDHSTGGSGGYYLFNSNYFPKWDKHQLLTPFIPYENICLRFWYNLPSTDSKLKVLVNGDELFSRGYFKTQGWEEKIISISLETSGPIQIAFESQESNGRFSCVGIDDVVIEVGRL